MYEIYFKIYLDLLQLYQDMDSFMCVDNVSKERPRWFPTEVLFPSYLLLM